jgi:peptidoglycan/xylan/chitin deacetylase (PgdA/CDA1 family)
MYRRPFLMCTDVPIISFTFDDFPRSALLTGGAILKRYEVRGTYYASLGLMGKEAPTGAIFLAGDLESLLAQGHELGCHTFAHCHSWKTRPSVFEESIIKNQAALDELLPGASFRTFSYPIMCPRPQTKRITGKYFTCCRGSGGQTFNVGKADANHLHTYFLEKSRENPERVTNLIYQNCRARGWLIFATHDVCDSPTPYGCTPAFFEEIVQCALNSGARILPVLEAWKKVAQIPLSPKGNPSGSGGGVVKSDSSSGP